MNRCYGRVAVVLCCVVLCCVVLCCAVLLVAGVATLITVSPVSVAKSLGAQIMESSEKEKVNK